LAPPVGLREESLPLEGGTDSSIAQEPAGVKDGGAHPGDGSADIKKAEADRHSVSGASKLPQRLRPRSKRKLYQDEIYGSKELTPLATAIIDTPEFQRLGISISLVLPIWFFGARTIVGLIIL
jgi:hypothetical protein